MGGRVFNAFITRGSWAMKSLSEFEGVYLHRDPVDMRKAINGLCEIVESEGMGELMGPNLFVFCGKRKNTIKILYFDKSGFALWQKRLEQNRFNWPKKIMGPSCLILTTEQMGWLLDGYDVWKMKPFKELRFAKVC